MNIGGWWNEREWEDGTREGTGEVKNTHKISIGTMKGRNTFWDLDLDEMLQKMWWTGHKGV